MSETTLEFGPFAGYRDSVDLTLLRTEYAAVGSLNMLFDPNDRKFYKRGGTSQFLGHANGLTEAKNSYRPRRIREIEMRVPTYPSALGTLITDEFNSLGCFHYYSEDTVSGGTISEILGLNNGSRTTERVVPFPTAGRADTAALRAKLLKGSCDFRSVQDWTYFGAYDEVPVKWNQSHGQGAGTPAERIRPWGHVPPMNMPALMHDVNLVGGAPPGDEIAATTGAFHKGKYFACAVVFVHADGSRSRPLMPKRARSINVSVAGALRTNETIPTASAGYNIWNTADLGYYTVNTSAAGRDAEGVTLVDIPIGGPDVVGREIYRTIQAASVDLVDLSTMSLWVEVKNNTQRRVRTTVGDGALLPASDLFRLDGISAPCSKYMAVHEQRVWVACTKPNPLAIYWAPTTSADDQAVASNNWTNPMSNTAYGACSWNIVVENTNDGDVVNGTSPATTEVRITLTSSTGAVFQMEILTGSTATIEDVIDYFNSVAGFTTAAAPPIPGVRMVAAPNFDVKTPARALRSTTGVNWGDGNDNIIGSLGGAAVVRSRMTAYSNAYPGALYVNTIRAGWDNDEQKNLRRIQFTGSGNGHPAFAANNFYVGNFLDVPQEAGEIIGIASAAEGLVVFCLNGMYVVQNTQNFNTNLDTDYVVRELNRHLHFVAPDTVIEGQGWAAALAITGMVATAGLKGDELQLTGDVLNSEQETGQLWIEASACYSAMKKRLRYNALAVAANDGESIWIGYRKAGGSTVNDSLINYSFTPSKQKTGLAALLNERGNPFGWSAPCYYNASAGVGPIVSAFQNSTNGRALFMAVPFTSAGTGQVELLRIETGYQDNGANYASAVYTALAQAPPNMDFSGMVLTVRHANGAAANAALVYGEALDTSASSYSLDVKGAAGTMGESEFDMFLADRINTRAMLLIFTLTANSFFSLWGAAIRAKLHKRR